VGLDAVVPPPSRLSGAQAMSVPAEGSPEQFHYPSEVVATIKEFAQQQASDAGDVACV
jgi:hypothetical protein